MKNTKSPSDWLRASIIVAALTGSPVSLAGIRLSSDWEDAPLCTNGPRTVDELAETPRSLKPRPVCPQREIQKLRDARLVEAKRLAATPATSPLAHFEHELPFQLHFDDRKYYIQPMRFMARDKPDEVCTPVRGQHYRCEEGGGHKLSCHLMFFNTQFELVGVHRIRIDEPFPVWCNAVPAIGTYDKTKNELLVTVQYFPTDRKLASTVSEVGSGWIRMTSLFRLKEENGKISVEQDDACLRNPNRIEAIPEARTRLKRCGSVN